MTGSRARFAMRRVLTAVAIVAGMMIVHSLIITGTPEPVYVVVSACVAGVFGLGAMRRPWFFLTIVVALIVVLPEVSDSSAHTLFGGCFILGWALGALAGWSLRYLGTVRTHLQTKPRPTELDQKSSWRAPDHPGSLLVEPSTHQTVFEGCPSMSTTAYVPEAFPHHWLPLEVALTTWEQIEPWYQQLLERPIDSPEALETWLRDLGELNGAVAQEGARRYIAMTCQTDDPDREQAHLAWVRDIEPRLKPLQNDLRARYLDSPHRSALPKDRYQVYDRAQANRRDLFRAANVPRETALAELEQQYQKTIGAMTVMFQGKEYTPAQMAPFLEETDRDRRQTAWELVAARRLNDRETLDSLFDQMRDLRVAIAREAGFDSFTDYAYRLRERFDYGVADAEQFQDAIERVVVPLAKDLQTQRRDRLKLDTLRPWDLSVDPLGRPPLRPFNDPDRLETGTQAIFADVDPDLGRQFAFMRQHGLLDLANRKGKAPGGYQTTLEDDRLPFIFMNAVGLDGDVRTLLHEGGHAFHALASRAEPLAAYREAPIEFCEVASMSMELLGARDAGSFYNQADAARSYRQLLEGVVLILPWIATVDAFQHWLYAHPNHSVADRQAAWNVLLDRFGGIVGWSGLEDARSSSWHRQLHIFLYPFYYIEYGIAQLGALQVWRSALRDRAGAVAAYRHGLSLGGSRPLPELFQAAGIRFDFQEATLRPLMDAINAELATLGE